MYSRYIHKSWAYQCSGAGYERNFNLIKGVIFAHTFPQLFIGFVKRQLNKSSRAVVPNYFWFLHSLQMKHLVPFTYCHEPSSPRLLGPYVSTPSRLPRSLKAARPLNIADKELRKFVHENDAFGKIVVSLMSCFTEMVTSNVRKNDP